MLSHRTVIEKFKYELKQLENDTDTLNRENLQSLRNIVDSIGDSIKQQIVAQKAQNELLSKQIVETRQEKVSLQH